jgi:hypothetical protein
MPVLRRAEETPAASKKEPLPSRGPPDIMIAFQPAETFVHSAKWSQVRFWQILLQKSAYRRRGTVDAIFDAVVVTRWIVRATYARLY